MRLDIRRLTLGVADKFSPFPAKKFLLGVGKIPHNAVTVGLEAVDLGGSDDTPAMTACRVAVLQHYIADKLGRKNSAIDRDAVELDEARWEVHSLGVITYALKRVNTDSCQGLLLFIFVHCQPVGVVVPGSTIGFQ